MEKQKIQRKNVEYIANCQKQVKSLNQAIYEVEVKIEKYLAENRKIKNFNLQCEKRVVEMEKLKRSEEFEIYKTLVKQLTRSLQNSRKVSEKYFDENSKIEKELLKRFNEFDCETKEREVITENVNGQMR